MDYNIGLNYSNIILKHNMSQIESRTQVDITTTDREWSIKQPDNFPDNAITLNSPVILTNMPSVQNEDILNIFNSRKWPYIYHRMGGSLDIYNFTQKINEENWHLKSISVGVNRTDLELLKTIKTQGLQLDWITIDVALIYNKHFEEHIRDIRKLFPDVYLIAGNGTTVETAMWLEDLGVNAFKQGIGTSNLCRTRQYTGFGTSIITDLMQCAEKTNLDIISDGGLTILDETTGEIALGDIFKALNFGAKWIMSSSLFRWVKELESPHGIIEQYGNSTARAKGYNRNVEGTCKVYKSNGQTLQERMDQITQNLQSSCSYAGITSTSNAYRSCKWEVIQ